MNFQKFREKTVNFLKTKKNLLIILLIFVILSLSAAVFIIGNNSNPLQDKSWELNLIFNKNTQKLSLEKLRIIDRKTIVDERQALYSPYKLEVLNNQGNVIFQKKINITEQILYGIFLNATGSAMSSPTELKSVIFIPYNTEAAKINILRQNSTVLQINLPKNISYSFVKRAEATTVPSVSCGPIQVVFINNNYTNTTQFKNDVSYLKNLYNNTPPYNVNPSIFDFQEIDNLQNFGCEASGIMNCINNKHIEIETTGLNDFPNAQKFIVLVDNPNALNVDQGYAGVVNGIGGNIAIFTNYVYRGISFAAATHEFEGHAVGWLLDRYVATDINYSKIEQGDLVSNCSTNSQGEPFWPGAGSTGVFRGCGNINQYAPSDPNECITTNPQLISGGPTNTVMSATGCTVNDKFDQVEGYWIKNNILPNYKPCPGYSPTPTLTAEPTASSTSTPTPTSTSTPTPTPTLAVTPTSFPVLNPVLTTPNPASTPASAPTYNCVMDPNCSSAKNLIQICYLKCTPN